MKKNMKKNMKKQITIDEYCGCPEGSFKKFIALSEKQEYDLELQRKKRLRGSCDSDDLH